MASPSVTSPTADQSTQESVAVSLDVSDSITDADAGDKLTFTATGLPPGSGFSIDANTGVLSGTPTSFDESSAPYQVVVRATDESGDFVQQSFNIDNVIPAAADLIWTHDHNTEAVGQTVGGVSGRFTVSTDTNGNEPTYAYWDIRAASDNPIYPNKKYFKTYMEQINGEVYRTERSGSGDSNQRIEMTSAGNSNWYAPQKLWYGFVLRIDLMDRWGVEDIDPDFNGGGGGGGIIWQWHERNFNGNPSYPHPGNDKNPPVSLAHQNGGIYLRLENNDDNGGNTRWIPVASEAILGETHAWVFEILWDSRTTAEGSTGILRLYLDGQVVAEWGNETTGKQNVHPMNWLDQQSPPRIPYLKYGGYRRDYEFYTVSLPNGTRTGFSWGNITIQGENANIDGVMDALDFDNII
jgi:hypothetical protein